MNARVPQGLKKILHVLRDDSSFKGKDSGYASHDFHAFAAKFPPQLPRLFIQNLTNVGETVLDPMVGSGTTVVEALLLGRTGIGFDIDPLAVQLSKIKTSRLDCENVRILANRLVDKALSNLAEGKGVQENLNSRFDEPTKDFINFWFTRKTQRELMSLLMAIDQLKEDEIRWFFQLVFSSIIITKSGGVSLARDLAHSRPHKDLTKVPKNAIEAFSARLRRLLPSLGMLPRNRNSIWVEQHDAKNLPLDDNRVDLIVTSPPYANAIDYMRAHKFSLVWFGRGISELSELRSRYVGSEKIRGNVERDLPPCCFETLHELEQLDRKKAAVLKKYFGEMKNVLEEMKRVLKPGKFCIVVVGNSTMRGFYVRTNEHLEEIGRHIGFKVFGNLVRSLDRDRRMLPASLSPKRTGIEHRMHEEFIILFMKP